MFLTYKESTSFISWCKHLSVIYLKRVLQTFYSPSTSSSQMITWINPTSTLAQSHHRARSLYFIVKGDIFPLYARLKGFRQRWCVYLLECTQLGPEVARDGSDLERQEGQRPVLSEGDGELHTSCIHPERKWEVKGKQGQICKYLIQHK